MTRRCKQASKRNRGVGQLARTGNNSIQSSETWAKGMDWIWGLTNPGENHARDGIMNGGVSARQPWTWGSGAIDNQDVIFGNHLGVRGNNKRQFPPWTLAFCEISCRKLWFFGFWHRRNRLCVALQGMPVNSMRDRRHTKAVTNGWDGRKQRSRAEHSSNKQIERWRSLFEKIKSRALYHHDGKIMKDDCVFRLQKLIVIAKAVRKKYYNIWYS